MCPGRARGASARCHSTSTPVHEDNQVIWGGLGPKPRSLVEIISNCVLSSTTRGVQHRCRRRAEHMSRWPSCGRGSCASGSRTGWCAAAVTVATPSTTWNRYVGSCVDHETRAGGARSCHRSSARRRAGDRRLDLGGLRRRRADLSRARTRPLGQCCTISHAIEDEYSARAERGVLIGSSSGPTSTNGPRRAGRNSLVPQ